MKFAVLWRLAVERPISARLPAEEERWKLGCWGLPGASDMRDPDVERMCCAVWGAWPKWFCDVERFMAEAGIGIADALLLIGPSVSRGRRTENMPLSCDMAGVWWCGRLRVDVASAVYGGIVSSAARSAGG